MMLTPEVALISDETMAAIQPMLDVHVALVESAIAAQPEFAEQCAANGWGTRSIALGLVVGLMAEHVAATAELVPR